MGETRSMRDAPEHIREWIAEIIGFLLKEPVARDGVCLASTSDRAVLREVGIVIQFWGGSGGEIVLLASRATARAFAVRLASAAPPAPGSAEEMKLIKGSLGELLNILSAKILSAYCAPHTRHRLTTPSCIFGRELFISEPGEDSASVAVDTPFGRLDIHLRMDP
jgi:CheY-specific phosphatase CheX